MKKTFKLFVLLIVTAITATAFAGCGQPNNNKDAVARLKRANFDAPTSISIKETDTSASFKSNSEMVMQCSADAIYYKEVENNTQNIEIWTGKLSDGKYYSFNLDNKNTTKTAAEITKENFTKAVTEMKADFAKKTDFDFSGAEEGDVFSAAEADGKLTIKFGQAGGDRDIIVLKDDKILSYEYFKRNDTYNSKCEFAYGEQSISMPDIHDGWLESDFDGDYELTEDSALPALLNDSFKISEDGTKFSQNGGTAMTITVTENGDGSRTLTFTISHGMDVILYKDADGYRVVATRDAKISTYIRK